MGQIVSLFQDFTQNIKCIPLCVLRTVATRVGDRFGRLRQAATLPSGGRYSSTPALNIPSVCSGRGCPSRTPFAVSVPRHTITVRAQVMASAGRVLFHLFIVHWAHFFLRWKLIINRTTVLMYDLNGFVSFLQYLAWR